MPPLWALLVALQAAAATTPPVDAQLKSLLDAQERGVLFLAESQSSDGSWRANRQRGYDGYAEDPHVRAAITAICLNGLRAAGGGRSEAAGRAEEYLRDGGLHPQERKLPPKPEVRVYALAYGMMAVSREAASPERDRRLQELVTETENLSRATNAFAYFRAHAQVRPASFQLAILASGLSEARAPSGRFAYYGSAPNAPGPMALDDAEGAAGRGPACEVALAEGGRGDADALARAVQCERQNMDRLARHSRRRNHPVHDYADHGVAPYYYLFSLHWTARALSRLPAADARAAARDILASILAQETRSPQGEPIGIWEDSQEFSGPNYGTGTVLDTLAVLRPYLTRP